MDIGGLIRSVLAAADAANATAASMKVDASATPDDGGGWNIEAGGVQETIPRGGHVRIGDTEFYAAQDGSLVVQQDGEDAVTYASPLPEAEQESAPPPPTTTVATSTTVLPPGEPAITVEIELQPPGENETSATLPEDPAVVTRGTLPEDPAVVTRGTLPEDPV